MRKALQGKSRSRTAVAIVAGLVVAAVAAAPAHGAASRAEYVAQADSICATATVPARAAFVKFTKLAKNKPGGAQALTHPKVVSHQVRGPASRLYRSLAGIYSGVNAQLATLVPVPEDVDRVNGWLALRGTVAADLQASAQALKNNRLHVFDHLLAKGRADTTLANNAIRDFGFTFCTPQHDSPIIL
jgi:hypothetical protein